MKEIDPNQLQAISGGLLWGVAWKTAAAAFTTTDAALNIKNGFQEGFNNAKDEMREKNGW
ncbi:hypothetical protein DRW07_11745 [Alteromonas sediminis]|uniref:Bacteriocin n=1 Tax=Alteromonas sediminis TaxID=2259342 RepID=A0A3N5XZW9_9ALTE|nr:hypothetical protein [Alteromonas sediminis]RPJ66742.1 hypothetical protein DRW07_11745 [Alteromonas sediminis]